MGSGAGAFTKEYSKKDTLGCPQIPNHRAQNTDLPHGNTSAYCLDSLYEIGYWDVISIYSCRCGMLIAFMTSDQTADMHNIFLCFEFGKIWRKVVNCRTRKYFWKIMSAWGGVGVGIGIGIGIGIYVCVRIAFMGSSVCLPNPQRRQRQP